MSVVHTPETNTSDQLGSAVRSAMVWNMVSMIATQLALSGIFILLAGRLDPVVFGVFGLAAVFVDFFYMQGSAACIDAAVQRQDFSRRSLSTYFWVSTLAATSVTAAMIIGGHFLSGAFNEPALPPVLTLLALTLLPMPLTVAPFALMRQQMDFKGIAMRNIAASLTGGVAALAVAFSPWPEWALVVQRWVALVVTVGIVVVHTRAFPSLEFNRPLGKSYLGSLWRIFTAQGICGAAPRLIDLIVAGFFGTVILGCLRVATKLYEVVIAALVNPIGQMVVVLVSKAGDAMDQRRAIFLQLSKLTALVGLPGFIGLALVSGEFTALVLQPEYAPVAPMLAVLCGLGLMLPVTNFRNSLLTSLNRLNMLVWFAVIDLVVVAACMLAAAQFGYVAVLIASGAPNITSLAFAMPFVLRQMNTSWRDFIMAVAPPYLGTGLMALSVFGLSALLPPLAPLEELLVKAGFGAAVYIGFLFIFFRTWSMAVVQALKNR